MEFAEPESDPVSPWDHTAELMRTLLGRHPSLRNRLVPQLRATEDAVWFQWDGEILARIQGRHWWGPRTTRYARMLIDELVREMAQQRRANRPGRQKGPG